MRKFVIELSQWVEFNCKYDPMICIPGKGHIHLPSPLLGWLPRSPLYSLHACWSLFSLFQHPGSVKEVKISTLRRRAEAGWERSELAAQFTALERRVSETLGTSSVFQWSGTFFPWLYKEIMQRRKYQKLLSPKKDSTETEKSFSLNTKK